MKLVTIILILFCANSWGSVDQTSAHFSKANGVSKTDFRLVLAALEKVFSPVAASMSRTLEFQYDWDADWAQAFARRWETDQVVIYGGIARIPGSTTDSLALILCHELGHLYGGEPFSDEYNKLALEGQADYFATLDCWDRVITEIPVREGNERDRAFAAALTVTAFFASNRGIAAPKIETPDTTVVTTTLKTHPEPQCRLDTYMAGLEKAERPRCWWAPEN